MKQNLFSGTMNEQDKSLEYNELESTNLNIKNVCDPFYTPIEKTESIDNQSFIPNKYFYIESYGCLY
jgi:hypothetical protein